jgi:micrococcal nuclease
MKKEEFIYDAYVVSVYDGDTITVDFDLGFDLFLKNQKIRLYGIDAPELKGAEKLSGLTSRDWLREKVLNKNIVIKTHKDTKEKYGRWLGEIYIDDLYINEQLITEGLAIKYIE